MLQILVWGVCAIIFGLGYCGSELAKIVAGDKAKETTGVAIFVFMVILAALIFALSIQQGSAIQNLLGK